MTYERDHLLLDQFVVFDWLRSELSIVLREFPAIIEGIHTNNHNYRRYLSIFYM